MLALFNGVGIDKSHIKTESTDVELGHGRIENNLHYVLDVQFDQDRMNATNATFTANMYRMKKLVLGLLYRERAAEKAAGKAVPLKTIHQRSCNSTYAVELLHRHLVTQEK